ncbi:MAG: OmpA family protein [Chitinophagales bacterium]
MNARNLLFSSTVCFMIAATCLGQDTNTRKNCFDDYNYMFTTRGTNPVTDGMQKVTVSVVDAKGKANCRVGQIMVKDNTVVPPLYIAREDGSMTETRGTFDRNFYRETDGKISFTIIDAMSPVFMLEGNRKVRVYFIDFLKPEPGQTVKAPVMNSHITIDTIIKKEDLTTINSSAKSIDFQSGKDKLTAESYPQLDAIVAIMKQYPDRKWIINGHTDNTGNATSNLDLSIKRATTVQRYFISKGIGADHLFADGHGDNDPIADNNTPEGRKMNRRVEIIMVQ